MKAAGVFPKLCKSVRIPVPETEHRFHPPRRWRFDFAWPQHGLALEVEGGIWIQGRYSRGKGMLADMEKYNTATLNGWRVLRVTPTQLCTPATITMVQDALQRDWPAVHTPNRSEE